MNLKINAEAIIVGYHDPSVTSGLIPQTHSFFSLKLFIRAGRHQAEIDCRHIIILSDALLKGSCSHGNFMTLLKCCKGFCKFSKLILNLRFFHTCTTTLKCWEGLGNTLKWPEIFTNLCWFTHLLFKVGLNAIELLDRPCKGFGRFLRLQLSL